MGKFLIFGNYSIVVLAVVILSVISYVAFNVLRLDWSYFVAISNEPLSIGIFTNHFLHRDQGHFFGNVGIAIFLLILSLASERIVPTLGKISFWYLVLPAPLASVVLVYLGSGMRVDGFLGLSLFNNFVLGFLLLITLLFIPLIFKGKIRVLFQFVLFLGVIVVVWVLASDAPNAGAPSHVLGYIFGLIAAFVWTATNGSPNSDDVCRNVNRLLGATPNKKHTSF